MRTILAIAVALFLALPVSAAAKYPLDTLQFIGMPVFTAEGDKSPGKILCTSYDGKILNVLIQLDDGKFIWRDITTVKVDQVKCELWQKQQQPPAALPQAIAAPKAAAPAADDLQVLHKQQSPPALPVYLVAPGWYQPPPVWYWTPTQPPTLIYPQPVYSGAVIMVPVPTVRK